MIVHSEAGDGDLIFCHAVGSNYGWYLNELAIVVNYEQKPKKVNPANYEYKIYLFRYESYHTISSDDFRKNNVEILARADGNNKNIKMPKINPILRTTRKRRDTKT